MARIAEPHVFANYAAPDASALATLSGSVRDWFTSKYSEPTLAQRFAWPEIRRGNHVLLASATGSGKTLAATLPILSQIDPDDPNLSCLYIVPTKSLANDVYKTLRRCVKETAEVTTQAEIRVGFRTGDSSAKSRRELFSHPPHVLVTTPESLAVLLTQAAATYFLARNRFVVIDEIHSLAPTKRGADLSLGIERLDRIAGGVQRIGLSATCSPLKTAADFLVGVGRSCMIAQVPDGREIDIRVEPLDLESSNGFVNTLMQRIESEMHADAVTLIFTNTRNLAERLTWAMRRHFPEWAEDVAVHHSSLSKSVRRLVERRLKDGTIRVVITSTSLELGVDFSGVDQVILVHSPGGASRLLQRIGRSGHSPQQGPRGLILTSSPTELLEAAVTAGASLASQLEPLTVPAHPLDVLCQHLASMAINEWWSPRDAYELVTQAYPYCELNWDGFQSCLDYLSGRKRDGSEWLPARLVWQNDQFTIADERTSRLVRRNLGTILTEANRSVRLMHHTVDGENKETKIGELEEPFADHLQPGDRFVLDGRCFEYKRKKRRSLLVEEAPARPQFPRWTGTGWPLSRELAERLYQMRMLAAEALRDGELALAVLLSREYSLSSAAVDVLSELFIRQEQVSEIPGGDALLLEYTPLAYGCEFYLHTPLARPGNEALARVVAHRMLTKNGLACTTVVGDLGFMVSVHSRCHLDILDWESLLSVDGFDADLRQAVEQSTLVKERFRSIAYIGLMLLRNPIGGRKRVGGREWAERRLFDQVRAAEDDFILLRQARAEVFANWCDQESALDFVRNRPPIRMRRLAQPSPLAEHGTQTAVSAVETQSTRNDALEELHSLLTTAR